MRRSVKKNEPYGGDSHTFAICAYQESPYLEECVRSLLSQTVKSHVCIATSTPNRYIMSIARKYGLCVHVNEEAEGIASDWNFACRCVGTPLVTLAHQDDIYCSRYTESVLEALNRCRHPLIAFTDYHELRDGKTVESSRLLLVKRLMLFPLKFRGFWGSRFVRRRILSFGSAICCPSVTMAMDNLCLPLFRNNMKSNLDWQAWEEISVKKGEFAYVSAPLMKHRIHEGSATSGLLRENARREEDLFMYRKFWPAWMAELLEKFYQSSERFNQKTDG